MAVDTKERISKILEAYFNDTLPPDLEGDICSWIREDGHREEKDAVLEELWDTYVFESHETNKELERAYETLSHRLGFPPGNNQRERKMPQWAIKALRVAAVFIPALLIAGSVYYLLNGEKMHMQRESLSVITVDANHTEPLAYSFPDSSRVEVLPGSSITYSDNFSQDRSLTLSGKASFNVTKDSLHPFVVSTPHLKITVLGTSFSVRAIPGEEYSLVSLYSGSVKVEGPAGKYLLTPGQELEYRHEQEELKIKEIPQEEMAKQGQKPSLHLDGVSLREIYNSIEANFNVTIRVNDGVSLDGSYTSYPSENISLDELLELLRYMTPEYTYRLEGNNIIVTR